MDVMNRRRCRPVVGGVLTLAALALAGCSGTQAVSQDVSGSDGYQVGDNHVEWVAPADRRVVTGATGQLLDGAGFDLAQWRGHVVVVNFWGSWCGPCQGEAAALEQVYRDDRSKGVEFLGVDIRDDRASAQSFTRSHHVTYPSLYDESNTFALHFTGVPPNATPTTIVLDRQGRIAARHSGAILYTDLRDDVAKVLAEPA
jgi:thiol-disulfide isomerase/thioredoxin